MKLFIIGSTGMAGQALVKEAVKKGYEVTCNARDEKQLVSIQNQYPSIRIFCKDAFELTKEDLSEQDVIIDAFATAPKNAFLHVDLATKLISLLRNSKIRIGFILGAGSLLVGKGKNQHTAFEDILKDPSSESWRSVPENQLYELDFLKNVTNVDWFGVSPGLKFIAGGKSNDTLIGKDHLLFNQEGISETTSDIMAYTIISELEDKKHIRERFTVING